MEFQTERNVYIRENASKLYGSLAYFASKILLELPLLLVFPLLENLMIFWAIGYRGGSFW
jgi:ABC-2 type transporter